MYSTSEKMGENNCRREKCVDSNINNGRNKVVGEKKSIKKEGRVHTKDKNVN